MDSTSYVSGDTFRYELLKKVELAIYSIVDGGAASYTIGSRSFTYNNLNDLIALRDKLKSELCGGISINIATFRGL